MKPGDFAQVRWTFLQISALLADSTSSGPRCFNSAESGMIGLQLYWSFAAMAQMYSDVRKDPASLESRRDQQSEKLNGKAGRRAHGLVIELAS